MPRRSSSQSPLQAILATAGTIIIVIIVVIARVFFGIGSSDSNTTNDSSNSGGIGITAAPNNSSNNSNDNSNSSGGTSADGLPAQSYKQTPKEITFSGCPPEGDGGDPVLNKNKNRVDDGRFQPTAFSAIANLTWPTGTQRTAHSSWSSDDAQQIAQAEGLPVAVTGYLALARQEGPETPNCHSSSSFDFHIWMIDHPGGSSDRVGAVVVEATPRVRANHPAWTVTALNRLATGGIKVRISGWLMFDPEHPEQLEKTRGTLWEIHPIIHIDVWQNGSWVSLDDYQG